MRIAPIDEDSIDLDRHHLIPEAPLHTSPTEAAEPAFGLGTKLFVILVLATAGYVAFSWHVAAQANTTWYIPPSGKEGGAMAGAQKDDVSGRSPAESSDITYFATIFDSSAKGWLGGTKSPTSVSQTALLSLASVPNLNGKLTLVTHTSYRGLPALSKIISPIIGLYVFKDNEIDFDTRPANWVLRCTLMQYLFVRRQKPGAKVVYVELDELFLPGAGRLFQETFDNHAFDAAFTFLPNCNNFFGYFGCGAKIRTVGYVNTGVILFRAGPKATLLLDLASKKTLAITGDRSKGGENQKAIGSFFPHLSITTNATYTNPELNITIHSALGGFGGPLNFNSVGCCHLPSTVVVAHFKAMKKEFSREKCCRDRVAVNPGAWRETCSCKQNDPSQRPVCKPIGAKQTTRWCEA
jgi:hypothetical protein|tara:strand:+ start:131 stop:1357 length:1227 start_codon:yes stop_codon:yes gene_type:complete